jgi:hypothetical protein
MEPIVLGGGYEGHWMISRDEAIARADRWVNGDTERGRLEVGLYEFDAGYVVWPIRPRADMSRPPGSFGAGPAVIDRETGELTEWPPLAPEKVADQYAARKAVDARFPAEVQKALRAGGWSPGREEPAAVAAWVDRVKATAEDVGDPVPELFDSARAVLAEFGSLRFRPFDPRRDEDFAIAPDSDPGDYWLAMTVMVGKPTYPIGLFYDEVPSELVMDVDGGVYVMHWYGTYVVAESVDEAIVKLFEGVDFRNLPEIR